MKILKPQHINKLFENQALGDQVIFEHKLEQWKQHILISYSFQRSERKEAKYSKVSRTIENIENKDEELLEQEDNDFHTAAVIVPQMPAKPQLRLTSNTPKSMEKSANVNTVSYNISATNPSKIIKPLMISTPATTTTTISTTTSRE